MAVMLALVIAVLLISFWREILAVGAVVMVALLILGLTVAFTFVSESFGAVAG